MDLHEYAVADIKGPKHKKILNQLRANYYNKDAIWIKYLHLQLLQESRSNQNTNDMTGNMLLKWKTNKYMEQCIFSMTGIRNGMEGEFSDQFKSIMGCAHISEKFQSAWGKHEKQFKFDNLLHCFFDANNQGFPNDDPRQLGGIVAWWSSTTQCALDVENLVKCQDQLRVYVLFPLWLLH